MFMLLPSAVIAAAVLCRHAAATSCSCQVPSLAGALRLLAYWGTRHADPASALRHLTCGTPIEARWCCPARRSGATLN